MSPDELLASARFLWGASHKTHIRFTVVYRCPPRSQPMAGCVYTCLLLESAAGENFESYTFV